VVSQANSEGENVARQLLTAESQIERASSELSHLEAILDDVCQIVRSVGFEFASISLVFPEHNTVEAIRGCGRADGWTNRAKHYLEKDPNLRDIQADIIQTQRTEIISGWDKRFDSWIYKTFNHERLIRVFTPILLVLDGSSDVRTDWVEYCHWEETIRETAAEGKFGRCISRTMRLGNGLSGDSLPKTKVIGTIEAGYELPIQAISPEQVNDLIKLAAQQAPRIWRAQLPYVLEVIAKRAKRILKADSTTLFFLRSPEQLDQVQSHFIYQVAAGEVGRLFLETCPPRTQGLGGQSIVSHKCQYIDDPEILAEFNPSAFSAGVRAIAAFPLQMNSEFLSSINDMERGLQEGVLYVVYQQNHKFTREQLRWGELFARRAVDAIRHAMVFQQAHNRERQMETLQSITQSLSRIGEGDPLHQIAWNTLNILGADVITIYEYIHTEEQFLTPPETAGWLRDLQEMDMKIDQENVPFALLRQADNVYAPHRAEHPIFQNAPFAEREGIESVAGILLKVDEEIVVGVMFINYRRFHNFPEEEKQLIKMLAASAAIAIKNQRRLYTFNDINLEELTIAPNQEQLLNLVVQKAVTITKADLGTLRLLDPQHRTLITKAIYPKNTEFDSYYSHTSIEEGITGWVARTGQSELVSDVGADRRYQAYFALTEVNSELCVPLINRNELLGVLNVESRQANAFNRRHLWMLKNLAYYTGIAIQNVENKERLVRMKTLTTFNDLAGQFVHLTNNDMGALRTFAQRIIRTGDLVSQENAQEILSLAEEILTKAESMSSWIKKKEQHQPINLCQAVETALNQISIPPTVTRTIRMPSNLPPALGGEQQLTSVFVNLIQNAVDAMPQGGRLHISGESWQRGTSHWISVCIQDTGVGIVAENLEKIFQFGYSARTKGKGMGFGLWWTQGYLEELEGNLAVESRFGEGAKFTVRLPACRPVNEQISDQ
jgi:GAF domain-containing protein